MYYTYAIASLKRQYIYIGLSQNIQQRLAYHNLGYNRTTKPYRPFKLIYLKKFDSRMDARNHEKLLKTTSGRKFLRSLAN